MGQGQISPDHRFLEASHEEFHHAYSVLGPYKYHIIMRILQTMASEISVVRALVIRLWNPYVYMVCGPQVLAVGSQGPQILAQNGQIPHAGARQKKSGAAGERLKAPAWMLMQISNSQ